MGRIVVKHLIQHAFVLPIILAERTQYGPSYSILKFFQVDSTGMFRMTSSARYCKKGVGSSRPNWRWIMCFLERPKANQIPPDLVVKTQVLDISEVIL